MSALPSFLRWFWRIYIPLAILILAVVMAVPLGSAIETLVAPIRGAQSIQVIERTPARLCWAWTFVKRRAVWSDNEDAFLTINGEPSGVVAPYDMDTGYPWGMKRFAVPPRTEPYVLRYCVALPPAVKPGDAVTVRQTAFYPGFLGLWRLAVPFPGVVSDRGQTP